MCSTIAASFLPIHMQPKIESILDERKTKQSVMNKALPGSVFVFLMMFLLIGGFVGIFILNSQINQTSQKRLYSPTGRPVTSTPSSLTLQLQQPEDDALTFQPSTVISGQTSANSTVLISFNDKNKVIPSEFDGSFSTVIQLDEGVNNITTVVVNPNGDQRSVQKIVFYSKEKI